MIEKVFNVRFDRWAWAQRAFFQMSGIRNIEPCYLMPSAKDFEVSVFGKSAKRDMNRIVKKLEGRVNDYS